MSAAARSRKCRRAVLIVRERDSRRQCARLGQPGVGHPGRRDGKGPALAGGKDSAGRAGDRGIWRTMRVTVWAALPPIPFPAVIGAGTRRRWSCSRDCRGTVPAVGERDPRRQIPRLQQSAAGHPGRRDGKCPGLADAKGGVVVAGDLARLVDRQGEGLGGGRDLTLFLAVMVNGYVPPKTGPGIPAIVAVPFLLSVNVTPDGSAPVLDNVELGTPVVATVNVPVWPVVKVVPAGLVIPGASVRRRAPCAIWRVAAAARTAPVALCVAMDPAGVVSPAPPAPGLVIRRPRQTWSEQTQVSCTSIPSPEVHNQ